MNTNRNWAHIWLNVTVSVGWYIVSFLISAGSRNNWNNWNQFCHFALAGYFILEHVLALSRKTVAVYPPAIKFTRELKIRFFKLSFFAVSCILQPILHRWNRSLKSLKLLCRSSFRCSLFFNKFFYFILFLFEILSCEVFLSCGIRESHRAHLTSRLCDWWSIEWVNIVYLVRSQPCIVLEPQQKRDRNSCTLFNINFCSPLRLCFNLFLWHSLTNKVGFVFFQTTHFNWEEKYCLNEKRPNCPYWIEARTSN